MSGVIEVGQFIPCSICHKRQAVLLCDMPKGIVKNMHITKTEQLPDGTYHKFTDYEESFKKWTSTCDNPICEKCSKEVNTGVHFCKKCLAKSKD